MPKTWLQLFAEYNRRSTEELIALQEAHKVGDDEAGVIKAILKERAAAHLALLPGQQVYAFDN